MTSQEKEILDMLKDVLDQAGTNHQTAPPDYAWSKCSACGRENKHESSCIIPQAEALIARLEAK